MAPRPTEPSNMAGVQGLEFGVVVSGELSDEVKGLGVRTHKNGNRKPLLNLVLLKAGLVIGSLLLLLNTGVRRESGHTLYRDYVGFYKAYIPLFATKHP